MIAQRGRAGSLHGFPKQLIETRQDSHWKLPSDKKIYLYPVIGKNIKR